MLKQDLTVYDPYPEGIESTAIYANKVGQTYFEINNYLGNVNAVITDRKSANLTPSASNASTWEAVVINTSDYYPFGMQMPGRSNSYGAGVEYRYAYNGMELDNEVSGNGNSYTTEFRQYDPRLGRWKSLDPLMMKFPWMSPYVAFDDNPVFYVDPYGLASEVSNPGGRKKDKRKNKNLGEIDSKDVDLTQNIPTINFSYKKTFLQKLKEEAKNMIRSVEAGVQRLENKLKGAGDRFWSIIKDGYTIVTKNPKGTQGEGVKRKTGGSREEVDLDILKDYKTGQTGPLRLQKHEHLPDIIERAKQVATGGEKARDAYDKHKEEKDKLKVVAQEQVMVFVQECYIEKMDGREIVSGIGTEPVRMTMEEASKKYPNGKYQKDNFKGFPLMNAMENGQKLPEWFLKER